MSKFYTIHGHTIESVKENINMRFDDAKICEISILPFGKVAIPLVKKCKTNEDKYGSQYSIGDVLTREDNPDRYGFITKENFDEPGYYSATRLCIIKFIELVTSEIDTNTIVVVCNTADFVNTKDWLEFECTFKEIADTLYPQYDITVMFLYSFRRGELDDFIGDNDD